MTDLLNFESIVAMGYMAYDETAEDSHLCPFQSRTPAWEAWQKGWRQAEKDADARYVD